MPAEDRGKVQMGKNRLSAAASAGCAGKAVEKPATPRKRSALGPRNEVPEFCGILPKFVLYWTSLAVASWRWSIILEDNRFKPHSTGFRKFFLLLFLLFFATIGLPLNKQS